MRLLKKLTSLTLSAFAVLVISGFISLRPVVYPVALASSSPGCEDLTITNNGTTTSPVEGNVGNADSGTISFRAYQDSYKTCLLQSKKQRLLTVMAGPGPKTPKTFTTPPQANFLEGWAWDTNLGPISFSCDDNGKNAGVDCGASGTSSIPYGVTVNGTSGEVRGFAYGANIGWISMGCDVENHNGKNLVYGDCGSVSYGVKAATVDDENGGSCENLLKGDLYGYAWTDTVGWINFCGAHLKLPFPITPVVNVIGVQTNPDPNAPPLPPAGGNGQGSNGPPSGNPPGGSPTDNPCTGTAANDGTSAVVSGSGHIPYANGSDSYNFGITLCQDGNPLTDPTLLNSITVTPDWTGTTLEANQIDDTGAVNCTDANSLNNCGAKLSYSFTRVNGSNTFTGEVKAIAPTNDTNKVMLNGINVNINGSITPVPVNPADKNLKFLQAVSATVITSDHANAAAGASDNEVFPRRIDITATKVEGAAVPTNNGQISIYNEAYKCLTQAPSTPSTDIFTFQIKKQETGTTTDVKNSNVTTNPLEGEMPSGVCDENPSPSFISQEMLSFSDFTVGPVVRLISQKRDAAISASEAKIDGVGFVLHVEYTRGSENIKYITTTVPNNNFSNQAAYVQGNVHIDVQKGLKEEAVTKSVGQYAQSKRDPYFAKVTELTGSTPSTTLDINTNIKTIDTESNPALIYVDRSKLTPKPASCKIIINTETFNTDTTLATVGCDIYIKQNVYNSTGKLGIIALADTNLPRGNQRKGGNIYICNAVTDIEANIVAEGSLFPYGSDASHCDGTDDASAKIDSTTGLPLPNLPQSNFKNQLAIVGSIISSNTYGGSFENPPVMGDGTLGSLSNSEDIATARLYDINFLRYAFTQSKDVDGDQILNTCWAEGVKPSKTIATKVNDPSAYPTIDCTLNAPLPGVGIVNIIYRAPTKEMKVFGDVK